MEQKFMRQVAAYAPMHGSPVITPSKRQYGVESPTLATAADIDDIINYLNASNIFPVVGGLYYQSFTAFSITSELLTEKISAQQIYILRRWDRLDGLPIAEPSAGRRGKYLAIAYIDGPTESIIR